MAALAIQQWDGGGGVMGGCRRATAHCWDDVRRGMHTQTRTLALEACAAGSLEVRRRQSWNIQQALFWMKCCCKVDWMYVVVCGLLGGGDGSGGGGPFVCVSE